jgi:hypothetical protein
MTYLYNTNNSISKLISNKKVDRGRKLFTVEFDINMRSKSDLDWVAMQVNSDIIK